MFEKGQVVWLVCTNIYAQNGPFQSLVTKLFQPPKKLFWMILYFSRTKSMHLFCWWVHHLMSSMCDVPLHIWLLLFHIWQVRPLEQCLLKLNNTYLHGFSIILVDLIFKWSGLLIGAGGALMQHHRSGTFSDISYLCKLYILIHYMLYLTWNLSLCACLKEGWSKKSSTSNLNVT